MVDEDRLFQYFGDAGFQVGNRFSYFPFRFKDDFIRTGKEWDLSLAERTLIVRYFPFIVKNSNDMVGQVDYGRVGISVYRADSPRKIANGLFNSDSVNECSRFYFIKGILEFGCERVFAVSNKGIFEGEMEIREYRRNNNSFLQPCED